MIISVQEFMPLNWSGVTELSDLSAYRLNGQRKTDESPAMSKGSMPHIILNVTTTAVKYTERFLDFATKTRLLLLAKVLVIADREI